jgi:pilus assembly protein Flp/PilA
MSKFKNWTLKKYVALKHGGEEGQGLAEYGLILALIAVVCILALTTLGTSISGQLDKVTAGL